KEKEEKIEVLGQNRADYQLKIQALSVEREKFIQQKNAENKDSNVDDFGTSINKSIFEKAQKLGYKKKSL
ncbi:MAG: hypothetical protein KJ941_00215, partial [Bacteroidetes bacterium]|nr:hypothetical protein [Bacteroidota bacterium]